MALSACLFGAMSYFARRASPDAHWSVVAAARAGIGAMVGIAVATLRGSRVRVRATPTMWLRSGFGTLAMACTFYALGSRALPLGDAATLFNLSPVILALLAPRVLGERSGRRVLLALPLSVMGTLLVLRPAVLFGGGGAIGHEALLPALVSVGAACASAVAMLMLRRASEHEPTEAIAVHFSITATVVVGSVAVFVAPAPALRAVVPIIGAGLCAGLAQLAMTKAYSLERAAHVSAVGYLQIATTAGLGALLLGEVPTPMSLAGMALVVAGGGVLWIAALRERPAR